MTVATVLRIEDLVGQLIEFDLLITTDSGLLCHLSDQTARVKKIDSSYGTGYSIWLGDICIGDPSVVHVKEKEDGTYDFRIRIERVYNA